ncbi:unnamed protein product [Hyaloperonospora brassicae]|uniref:FHA domain-containing protein n=1 Tax=Hyaloperonospora brassicae TaxID=162125 RepID=A0AAV0T5E7_HYABA|nr:unnamed protein product [Hyaloperonospora brassicae]
MWVVDVVADSSSAGSTTFSLVAGEWTVGRTHCDLTFATDASVSRTHALLRVGALTAEQLDDPATRPPLELVDTNSRFGSFVNHEQCFGTRQLQAGDEVSFGAKKIVLRVRYHVFVLVASRLQRSKRAQVHDACQCLGMHLIAGASKDATHCIMDQGRIVATVKVLWALVYNQPVVCTQWLDAILNRSSLSDPLPRCEEFLPADPSMPSVERNYLPNALRKTLYRGLAVVFLTPQSMQELIPAMDGVVVTAYKHVDSDEHLLRELYSLTSSKRLLLVEPLQGAGSSCTAGQSDQQASASSTWPCHIDIVERRVRLFEAMGAVFTSVQELAASVIFVQPPASSNGTTFNHNLASYAGSSIQSMSSPEHMSVRSLSTVEHTDKKDASKQEQQSKDTHNNATMTKASKQLVMSRDEDAEIKGDDASTDPHINVMQLSMEEAEGHVGKSRAVDLSTWKSSRLLRQHGKRPEQHDDAAEPVVVSCKLVVKKRESFRQSKEGGNGLVNYKRFKKRNGGGSRASLLPQQTVVSVVNNADRVALHENLEMMEEQERIAEELFAMGEGRAKTKLFQTS